MIRPDSPPRPDSAVAQLGARLMTWFLGDADLSDPEEARRARLIVASALALTVIDVLVLAVSDWGWAGNPSLPRAPILGVLLSIPVNVSIAYLVRQTGSAGRAGGFLLASLVIIFSFIATFGGGYGSPITWWLAIVPLFGAFLAGTRGALLSTFMVTGVLVAMFSAESEGVTGRVLDLAELGAAAQLRGQLSLLALVTFVALYYDRMRVDRDADLVAAYSELEEAHRALRFSQLHIWQIAENIGQAIWMYDAEAERVLYANTGFEDIYGRPREVLVSAPRAWSEWVVPEDVTAMPVVADGADHVYRITSPSGEVRWIRHAVYAVADDDGRQRRYIHIAANITMRRMAEELRERFIESVIQAQETERRHLARELHDGTSQSLAALLVGLKMVETRSGDEAQRTQLGVLREQLREVVGEIRRMSRGLHPAVLDSHGLIVAVQRLTDDARELYGLRGSLRVEGGEHAAALPKTVQLTVYRICQEALTNVTRHAKASQVDVVLTIDEFGVHLRVEDDGRGFDPRSTSRSESAGSGIGLLSMRERAALLRGEVQIESAPGSGTTVLADLPLHEPTEALLQPI
jgi:PAS domain S-box-containing protein